MPTLMAIKVSILLLYGRLFAGRVLLRLLWTVGIFIALYTLASTVVCLVQCIPLSKLWDPSQAGECFIMGIALTIFGSLNVVTNIVLLALPIPLVWRLNVSKTAKVQITALFLIGAWYVLAFSILQRERADWPRIVKP